MKKSMPEHFQGRQAKDLGFQISDQTCFRKHGLSEICDLRSEIRVLRSEICEDPPFTLYCLLLS
jgi:hypothetical protein